MEQDSSEESTVVIRGKGERGFYGHALSVGGGKWSGGDQTLKVESTGFPGALHRACKMK